VLDVHVVAIGHGSVRVISLISLISRIVAQVVLKPREEGPLTCWELLRVPRSGCARAAGAAQ
jgi:hypothetical protein